MKKTTLIALLTIGLSTAACTMQDPTPPGSGEGGLTTGAERVGEANEQDRAGASGTMGEMSDPVCAEFFGGAVPLAGRAQTDRDLLAAGEVTDKVTYGEVNLLKQRIDALGGQASPEQAALLETINAPFTQASEAVQTKDALDAETGEITLPEIAVDASATAQSELEALCQG